MIGIIFYKENANRAKEELLEIKEQYEEYEKVGVKVLEHKDNMGLICSNGDRWKICKAAFGPGSRCNIAYIEKGISDDFVKECIIPCCNLPPYSAYRYYF